MSDQNDNLAALFLGIQKETEKIIKFKAQARVQVDDQANRIEQCSDVSHVQRESIAKLQNSNMGLTAEINNLQQEKTELCQRLEHKMREVAVLEQHSQTLISQLATATTKR